MLETQLKFTPLEFETSEDDCDMVASMRLKFTPLEFETLCKNQTLRTLTVKIYSVGV